MPMLVSEVASSCERQCPGKHAKLPYPYGRSCQRLLHFASDADCRWCAYKFTVEHKYPAAAALPRRNSSLKWVLLRALRQLLIVQHPHGPLQRHAQLDASCKDSESPQATLARLTCCLMTAVLL